jgi:hypothetical protein
VTIHRTNVDQHPESEFVRKMRDVFRRRDAAKGQPRTLQALHEEMVVLMRTYLGRNAWDALRDAEAVQQAADVPRDTSRDRSCHTTASDVDVLDRKAAAAGKDAE